MASLCVSLSLFNPLPFPLRHYFIRGVNLVYVAPGFVCTVYWDLRTQKSNTIRTIVVYNLLQIQFHKTYVHKSAVSCADTSQLAVGFKDTKIKHNLHNCYVNLQWIQFYKTCVQKYAVSRRVFATQLAV